MSRNADSTRTVSQRLDTARAAWLRFGIAFAGPTATDPVDLEHLIVETSQLMRWDERLAVCVATWLSQYHPLVDGRRLSERVRQLRPKASAYLGALLTFAVEAPDSGVRAPEFDTALTHCRPLARSRPLYEVTSRWPSVLSRIRSNALPLYRRWGFWHDDDTLKPTSIHPMEHLHCVPELRARALCGPSVEASCLAFTLNGTTTTHTLSLQLNVTYAATHAAVQRLVGRGLLARHRHGVRQELTLTDFAFGALMTGPPDFRIKRRGIERGTAARRP